MPTEQKLTREQWIAETYRLLCEKLGAPKNATEEKNLREWAELMASGGEHECNYYAEGDSPEDAVWEEMQAGS